LSVRADFFAGPKAELSNSAAAGCGQPPLPLKYVRILPKTFTILEIAYSQGGALATPLPVASALKAKSKFAESRRKKKNEEKRKN